MSAAPPPPPSSWILQGYIDDEFAIQATELQGRDFLCKGVAPVVGQRVEVNLLSQGATAATTPVVHLSGQVMQILPNSFDPGPLLAELSAENRDFTVNHEIPAPMVYPKTSLEDPTGSAILSGLLAIHTKTFQEVSGTTEPLPPDMEYVTLHEPGGSTTLLCMPRKRFLKNLLGGHRVIFDMWSAAMQDAIHAVGGVHGQQVQCQGRLNFDHDLLRASEEGPWQDGIPIDGRHLYQWTMTFDENLEYRWKLDVDSLVRCPEDVQQPRGWPWTLDESLPYERCGCPRDHPPRVNRNGTMCFHLCLGPFGCSGDDHPHNFAHAT